MRFLFDQSTDRRLASFFRQRGHNVTVVAIDHPAGLPDPEVLAIALGERRILVTEDSDFGELVFRLHLPHAGILYLRLPPMELDAKVECLDRVLIDHADELSQFVVVTPRRTRVRQ